MSGYRYVLVYDIEPSEFKDDLLKACLSGFSSEAFQCCRNAWVFDADVDQLRQLVAQLQRVLWRDGERYVLTVYHPLSVSNLVEGPVGNWTNALIREPQ